MTMCKTLTNYSHCNLCNCTENVPTVPTVPTKKRMFIKRVYTHKIIKNNLGIHSSYARKKKWVRGYKTLKALVHKRYRCTHSKKPSGYFRFRGYKWNLD